MSLREFGLGKCLSALREFGLGKCLLRESASRLSGPVELNP